MTTFGPYVGRVVSIHDGDTFRVELDLSSALPGDALDLGFGVQVSADARIVLNCRLFGINAPELSTDAGKAARDYLETLIAPGDHLLVVSHGWDKYGGRFDGSAATPTVADLSAAMVNSGHAKPLVG